MEVSKEPNPRQSGRRERVELTILSRGPGFARRRAADDRYTALDLAFANSKPGCGGPATGARSTTANGTWSGPGSTVEPAPGEAIAPTPPELGLPGGPVAPASAGPGSNGHRRTSLTDLEDPDLYEDALLNYEIDAEESASAHLVPIPMEGDGPLVVREKLHQAEPMTIDRALLEMELVGHDFYLFHDRDCGLFSVVYRRRGYDYGVIRLMEGSA